MQFQKEVEIRAPREKVWNFIWDVDRFIACVPGCKEAKTIEPGKKYAATMVEKVGPFKVEFPTQIEVLERAELSHIKAHPGMRLEEIGKALGTDTKILKRPIANLLAGKALKTQGQRRGTKYFAGGKAAGKRSRKPKE